ncbi:mitochondrial K+-H+ exchange-related-domain-containing protein [Pisolithus albus]|nr:mitochondrial K+-H+ exchange-related-domain-containing protein [Pisolithus albus]
MSLVPKPMPSLRIVALPLARARNASPSTALVNRPLVYYHFNLTLPSDAAAKNKSWTNGMFNKLTTMAANAWANFGKAPEGSWKARLRLYQHGERLVDRIDFEELALKGVDPSLSPSFRNRRVVAGLSRSNQKGEQRAPVVRSIFLCHFLDRLDIDNNNIKIPLIYPPSVYSTLSTPRSDESVHPSLSHLRVLLDGRGPRHRRGFYFWSLVAPLTFPLTIIPVIPNIPFFFCVWRSWSHYRAYKSSQYLSSLIDQGFVRPEPSRALDDVYRLFSPSASNTNGAQLNGLQTPSSDLGGLPENATDPNPKTAHHLLLSRKAVPKILELFSLPNPAAADMYRAMEQVRVRLQAGPR